MRKTRYTIPVTRSVKTQLDNCIGPAQEGVTDMSQVKIMINGKTQWINVNDQNGYDLFSTYATDFIKLYRENGSVQKNTLVGYNGYMHNHLLPFFGNIPVSEITPNLLQKYINQKSKKYTAKTISEHLNLLRPIFDAAVEDGILPFNPCNSPRLKLVGRKSTKIAAYTEEEFGELENLLQHIQGTSKLFLALSLYTGMRQGEMFALQWQDIDLEHSCIRVNKSVEWPSRNKGRVKEPKTENGYRTIFIISQLLVILSEQYCTEGYVLTAPRQVPGEPMTHQAVKRLNDRINEAAKKYDCPVRFLSHRARHTVATFMNNAGVDDVSITSTMGHSDVSFTKRQYVNHQAKQVQRGMNQFSEYLLDLQKDQ